MSKNSIAVMLTGDATSLIQAFHTGRLAATSFGSTMNDSFSQAKRASDDYENSATRLGTSVKSLTGLLKGAAAGLSVMKVIEMADDWGQYASRMKMATESTAEYEHAQSRMVKSAQATFRSVDETREAFINLSPVLRDMGMSLDQSIDVVDAFSGLLVTAGANAQRGASAMSALEKSFQRGKVSAQDWMTIYSTADGILEHLVETTGKSANELRRLGVEGKLSATDIADALTAAYEPVMKQVAEMPTTVGDALTNLKTNIGELVGTFNEGVGGTSILVTAINLLSSNLDVLAYVGGAVAVVMGTRFVAAQMAGVKALLSSSSSVLANRLALLSLSAQISGTSRAAVVGYSAMATAARAASGAMALLGGATGVLTLAATVGAGAWLSYKKKAEENKHVLESMRVPVEQLREELNKLTQSQLEERQFLIGDEIEESEKKLSEFAQAIQSIEKDYDALAKVSGVTKEELENVKRTLTEARSEYDASSKELEELKTKQDEVGKSLGRLGESARTDLSALNEGVRGLSEADFSKLITGLESSLSVIGMTNQQTAEYKARLDGANDEQARLAGVLSGMSDAARMLEQATKDKDATASKGAQELLDKLIAQEVQLRINIARQAEYAALLALGIEATIAAQGADTAAELIGLKTQEEIIARIKTITDNISANTVPTLKKTSSGVKQLSTQIDSLIGSLFPAIKAEKDWINNQKLLDQALKKGQINQTQYKKGLKLLRDEYEKTALVVPAHVKAIQDEAASIKSAIPGLRERVDTFGLSAAAIASNAEAETRARIATLENIKAVEIAKGASTEYVRQIEDETKALKELLIYQEHQTGLTQDLEHKEARQQAITDFAEEAKRTHDEIERSLTDSLMRSFESGKGFAKSFLDSIKSLASTLILRPIVQPISEGIAGAVTGALGMGKGGSFGLFDGLGMASNLNSLAGAFSGSLVSSMGSGIASLGTTFGSSAMTSFAAGMKGSTLAAGLAGPTTAGAGGAMGAGAAFASVAPWLAGGLAAYSLVSSLTNKGETRSGGGFQYTPANDSTFYGDGPSGGYGGDATLSAVDALLKAQYQTINSVIEGVGAQNIEIASIVGSFESSKKGRGGTSSGGQIIIDGQSQYFGSINDQGHLVKGQGYGGKSGTAEEMFTNLQAEVHFSALEAWKAVGDKMPAMIRDMLDGVDVRALSVDQAQALVTQIADTTGQVNQLITALDDLPLDSLKGLSFDLAGSLAQAAGGVEQFAAGAGSFYKNFYSIEEQQRHLMVQYESQINDLGLTIAGSRDAHRDMVEALNATDEGNHKMIAGLLNLSDVADQYYAILEQRASSFSAMTDSFRSDQEIFSRSGSELSRTLANIGYDLPDSKRGFLQLLESIDMTTESGLAAADVLLSVSSIAGNYYTELERLADEAMRNASEAARKTDEELARQRDSISRAAEDIARSFTSVMNSIQGNIGSLYERITLDIMDNDEDKYNYYKTQFDAYAKQLSVSNDATEIQNLVSKMTSSAGSAYNLLDEDVRKGGKGQEYLDTLSSMQAGAGKRLEIAKDNAVKEKEREFKVLGETIAKEVAKIMSGTGAEVALILDRAGGNLEESAAKMGDWASGVESVVSTVGAALDRLSDREVSSKW